MGLAVLVLGLIVFIAPHALTMARGARGTLVGRMGEVPYKIVYSLVAVLGIALIAWGYGEYRATGWIQLWNPPPFMRHVTVALMWPSIVCIAAAYSPGHIKKTLKHPMLVGVKLWAFAHLLTNGDLGSIVLFGSILAWAVVDRISLKRRTDPGAPPIPIGGWKNDVVAVIAGTIVYLALGFLFHPLVIGVPAFTR
ncbi:MAG: NnrU family protein [Hyphomicrobiales bacterium]|nr:NnrU family protein [Hyphomicrobiales bacterium]MBV9428317.1 NnrU family protein [Bradyrhizobiaceae bacterium]